MAASGPHAKTAPEGDDVGDWVNRFKAVAADHTKVTAPASPQASTWHNRMLGFYEPVDTGTFS